jgi:glycine dehydrogenase
MVVTRSSLAALEANDDFVARHIGPDHDDVEAMLAVVGASSVDELLERAVPRAIRSDEPLALPAARSETDVLAALRAMADRNDPATPLIGTGYHGTITPPVILRNVFENPAWYTAYTPYQPEISQGRLEALLTFQTMVADLTALPLANASLLDEATAAAEAMAMCRRVSRHESTTFFVDADTHPQTVAVVRTRAEPIGVDVVTGALDGDLDAGSVFGVLVSQPASSGPARSPDDLARLAGAVHAGGGLVVAATDPLSLLLLTAPGTWGADIAVGSTQRFGVPMMFGGPHAAFLATRDALARSLPGRLVGVSTDTAGRPALRLALQTREQHIRRDRATSNICTAQVLLANMAAFYAVWHGPEGLRRIAERVHRFADLTAAGLRGGGVDVLGDHRFDALTVRVPGRAAAVLAAAHAAGIDLRPLDEDTVGLSVDETTTAAVVEAVWSAFGVTASVAALDDRTPDSLPAALRRTDGVLTHPVFHRYRTEHEMLRYLRRLADRDLALDRTMIPLGSCTMKLNATAEMVPITWPGFADVHPFSPPDRTAGYRDLISDLERRLAAITGFAAVSVQPNAGSQGELAGLLAIRAYHRSRGDDERVVCLIPSSAHGTNAASAVMAGMEVAVVACDDAGNVDLDDLRRQADAAGARLAAAMVTYPSTHGVYEEGISELCAIVHEHGGQVYVDGANLNALVGVARPGDFGADVSHLNLHKTFCIPHGGGGPGVGPVAVRAHLTPFLPGRQVGPVAGAPHGSAGILPITWAYLALMGAEGLRAATATAVLAANYVARRLDAAFPVLYVGEHGDVAHECILDLRPLAKATGITAEDVAKRLTDYGFHAPTLAFPVPGTLMVEPTESESRRELDRFCDAMIAIRSEIDAVAAGQWPRDDNPLRNAPHTAEDVTADDWTHPYTRQQAAFPARTGRADKYFPPVSRVDSAYGDRNLVCSCPPIEAYAATSS